MKNETLNWRAGLLGAALTVVGVWTAGAAPVRIPLDSGWRFCRSLESCRENDFTFDRMSAWLDDAMSGRQSPRQPGANHPFVELSFKDGSWRAVNVPHDWGIEGAFGQGVGGYHEGFLDMTGVGWYRIRLNGAKLPRGSRYFFDCDGAASFAMVWINGRFVGGWPYQYTPWRVDLTPGWNADGENVIAVRTEQYYESNRWYGGAGLYRPCALVVEAEDHVLPGSVRISSRLLPTGDACVTADYEMSISGRRRKSLAVPKPRLWSLEDPYLHTLRLEGRDYRYGIRTAEFFADGRGFRLNGRRVQLRGMCLHQDLGALGSAWNRSAWKRRLLQLKQAGVNAIRMSHYCHADGLYDLCDELGFVVLDETFDTWERGFCENDYHRLFATWAERDLRASIRARRNHPSVVARTVGNEISEQRSDFGEVDLKRFEEIGRRLYRIAKEEDPDTPVLTANNDKGSAMRKETQWVDIYGFNYKPQQIAAYHARHPDKPTMSTESGCVIATRGEYFVNPLSKTWEMRDFRSCSYGRTCICSPDSEFAAWETTPSHLGAFFWTGFDYLGGPFAVPRYKTCVSSDTAAGAERQRADLRRYGRLPGGAHTCETGLFDTAGFPRDTFYLFQAKWRDDLKVLHVLPHWNWSPGLVLPVHAYSNADEVELFVNGHTLGRRRRAPGSERFVWEKVAYEPGELRAVGYRNGERWTETVVETTGAPVRLSVEPLPAETGDEYLFFTVKAVDAKGRVVPHSRIPARFRVEGAGTFVAADNGDGADFTWYRYPERDVFNGYCSVIVRPDATHASGASLRLVAEADGLASGFAEIACRPLSPAH